MSSEKKLLYAIDPFVPEVATIDEAVVTLENFSRQMGLKTQAVSVATPDDVGWPRNLPKEMIKDFEGIVLQKLKKMLDLIGLTTDFPPKILYQPTASRRTAARAMADYAKQENASAVAVIAGLKKKPWLSLPGGFVETLLGLSPAPVLVVSARSPVRREFRVLLMPTDLTPESDAAAEKCVAIAKTLAAKLVVFHVLADSPSALAVSGAAMGGDIATVNALFEEDRRLRTRLAEQWRDRARAEGLESDVVLWPGRGVNQAILETEKAVDADMILMAAKAGPLEAAFIGSTTREVMAESKVPVLVIRGSDRK